MVFAKLFEEAQKKKKEDSIPSKSPSKDESKKQKALGKRKRGKMGHVEQPINNNKHKRPLHRKGGPPSVEVLEFSRKLKDLSRQKKLDEAVSLYWSSQYDEIRDEHHACIVVDCCARCGDVTAAEQIVHQLQQNHGDSGINVETQTALLKAYVHAGMMTEAMRLFRSIDKPNVRTLNTLLRGCLWTAAAPTQQQHHHHADERIAGGVVTSEKAWKLYQDAFPGSVETLDASSYEYSISLLCQALRVRDAEARIETFLSTYRNSIRVQGKASVTGSDQSALETLAVVYLALSRAYSLLHPPSAPKNDSLWLACQRSLSAIRASRALLVNISPSNETETLLTASGNSNAKRMFNTGGAVGASGGKRGWKATTEQSGRIFSNVAFRTHRLSELEDEVRSLLKSRDALPLSRLDVAVRIRNSLLYFSGGGSTITGNNDNAQKLATESKITTKESKNAHLISSWYSFGLSQLALDEADMSSDIDPSEISDRCGLPSRFIVRNDGTINFNEVFQESKRPLDIEIGAGFGSWIVQQAQENIQRNYVAVELRADRGFQIFARATLGCAKSLDNVCVVGSECGIFLRDRVEKSSVSTIYANHPEPPTQTYGDDQHILRQIAQGENKEPAHMLNSKTIIAMGKCLEQHGRIIIVTDNRSYSRLLAATFAKVVRENKGLVRTVKPSELKNTITLRHLESFANVVDLYTHNSNAAHGTSYFDRLWRTGAGSHSEKHTRFVILMQRS